MRGSMMETPLLVSSIIEHASHFHGDVEIVTRSVEGPLHRALSTGGLVGYFFALVIDLEVPILGVAFVFDLVLRMVNHIPKQCDWLCCKDIFILLACEP
jgi:hypothetical protein